MPRTKKTETEALAPVEPKKRRTAAAPKTTAVNHKHTVKKSVPSAVVDADVVSAPAKVVTFTVKHEDVAQLAYSYWVARGYQGGSPQEDWLRAEQQLKG